MKQHPIPGDDVFRHAPSPRPLHAQLPLGWHDNRVDLVAAAPETQVHLGVSEPSQTAGQGSYSDMQPEMYPTATLDGARFLEIIVDKVDGHNYWCHRRFDNACFCIPADSPWVQCDVLISGKIRSGHVWEDDTGAQYYLVV
ncbi:hypothetical protein DCS_02442 [Drechmeria coniospora]|uniref:Uncharacterized protein n=1 Tax=Drechmeria coniospora TaxID=98403 RepID=A0A151GW52_DRECN|nr:hypothetical protein DCS_02442 [Drechmeria coniospora]KYK61300.1 hypothetical protein DCS_02442 [Drechmeria coniospora]